MPNREGPLRYLEEWTPGPLLSAVACGSDGRIRTARVYRGGATRRSLSPRRASSGEHPLRQAGAWGVARRRTCSRGPPRRGPDAPPGGGLPRCLMSLRRERRPTCPIGRAMPEPQGSEPRPVLDRSISPDASDCGPLLGGRAVRERLRARAHTDAGSRHAGRSRRHGASARPHQGLRRLRASTRASKDCPLATPEPNCRSTSASN